MKEICIAQVPRFEQGLGEAQEVLVSWSEAHPKRVLASVPTDPLAEPPEEGPDVFPRESREHWMNWSANQLKVAQRAIDLTENRENLRPVRRVLGDLAAELVMFNGYAMLGDVQRMSASTTKLAAQMERFKELACR